MTLSPLDTARASYLWRLRQAYPDLEAQLADVNIVLDRVLSVPGRPPDDSLALARAIYIDRLRGSGRGIDDQIADLARACSQLYVADLVSTEALRPPRQVPMSKLLQRGRAPASVAATRS